MIKKIVEFFRSKFASVFPRKTARPQGAHEHPAHGNHSPHVEVPRSAGSFAPPRPGKTGPNAENMGNYLIVLGHSLDLSPAAVNIAIYAMNNCHAHDDATRGRQAEPVELARLLSMARFVELLSFEVTTARLHLWDHDRAFPDEDPGLMSYLSEDRAGRFDLAVAELVMYAARIGARSCVPPPMPELPEGFDFESE